MDTDIPLPEIVLIPSAFFVFHQWLAGWLPCCVQSPKLSYEEEEEENDDVSQQGSSHGAECDNNKSKHCKKKKKKKKKWQGIIYDLKQR